MGDTDKQFTAKLIEDYYYNLRILKLAKKEGAKETIKEITQRLAIIKLQLHPLELPDNIDNE